MSAASGAPAFDQGPEGHDPLARLGAAERGLLAGVFLGQGGRADFDAVDALALEARLAGLAEGPRQRLGEVIAWLAERDRDQRASRLARVMRGLVSPVPPGLAQVHPDWIEDALLAVSPAWWPCLVTALPPQHRPVLERLMSERAAAENEASLTALPALAEPAPTGASADEAFDTDNAAAIVRAVLSVIAPMEKGDGSDEAEAWLGFEGAAFDDEVLGLGAMALGHSLSGAEGPVLERAARPFGEPWTARVLAAAAAVVEPGVRATSRACLIALPPMTSARATLLTIGATALGFRLRDEPLIVQRRVAQRLPRAAGERLLRAAEPARARRGGAA